MRLIVGPARFPAHWTRDAPPRRHGAVSEGAADDDTTKHNGVAAAERLSRPSAKGSKHTWHSGPALEGGADASGRWL